MRQMVMPELPEKSEYVWQPPALGPPIWLQVLRPHTWILFRWWQSPANVGITTPWKRQLPGGRYCRYRNADHKTQLYRKRHHHAGRYTSQGILYCKERTPGPGTGRYNERCDSSHIMNIPFAGPATINRETETIRKEDLETAAADDSRKHRNRISLSAVVLLFPEHPKKSVSWRTRFRHRFVTL